MIQIIPQSSSASNIGSAIGRGLGSGLQALADTHLQKLIQKEQRKDAKAGLEALGYSPADAAKLANFDPQILKEVIKQKGKQPSEAYINALNNQYGGQQGSGLEALANSQSGQRGPDQKLSQDQFLEQLRNNLGGLKLGGLGQESESQFQPIGQQQAAPQVAQQRETAQGQKAPIDFSGMSHKEIENTLKAQQQTADEIKREKIEGHKALQQKKVEAQAAHKETKAYYDELIKKEKSAEQDDIRLGRLEKLVKNGNLPYSALWSTLTKIEDTSIGALAAAGGTIGGIAGAAGGPLALATAGAGALAGGIAGSLISPLAGIIKTGLRLRSSDVEEFEKLSTDFVKNAKQYFGSRLTDADLKAFMSTIPSLMQTDAGKLKVINNLREFNKVSKTEARLARQIIRANGGLRPPNLDALVHDALAPEIDKLAEQFSQ